MLGRTVAVLALAGTPRRGRADLVLRLEIEAAGGVGAMVDPHVVAQLG